MTILPTYLLHDDGTLYQSLDTGATWTDISSAIPSGAVIRCIASDDTGSLTVAGCEDNRMLWSPDPSSGWTELTFGSFTTLPSNTIWTRDAVVSYDPGDGFQAVLAGSSVVVVKNLVATIAKTRPVGEVFSLYMDGLEGVCGTTGKAWRTIDGGYNWTVLNNNAEIVSGSTQAGKIVGIWQEDSIIVACGETGVWRSNNSGLSFSRTYEGETASLAIGKNNPSLVWITGTRGLIAYSTNNGLSFEAVGGNVLDANLDTISASLTKNGTTLLYAVDDVLHQRNDSEYILFSAGKKIGGIFSAPDPNNPICYTLTDCNGVLADVYTDTDLSLYVGTVVEFQEITGPGPTVLDHPGCWILTSSFFDCTGSPGYIADVVVTGSVNSCSTCRSDACYTLTNCEDTTQLLANNTFLIDFIGKVIKICKVDAGITTCTCYLVEEFEGNCTYSKEIEFNGVDLYYDDIPKDDCDCCLETPPPVPVVIPYVQFRLPVQRDHTKTLLTDCQVDALSHHATLTWEKVHADRNGLRYSLPSEITFRASEIQFRLALLDSLPSSGLCLSTEIECGCDSYQ